MKYKLTLSYDGTNYLGWQKTDMGPSIEKTLEDTLIQILQHPIQIQAASRTDAGVHAQGQIIDFKTEKEIDPYKLKGSINQLLPEDLSILHVEKVPESFHPTLDCKEKEYRYHITYGDTRFPLLRFQSWHVPGPLNHSNTTSH